MILLNALDFSLPLKDPVIIFSIVLFIILFAPILLNKLKIPHIIGLIIAGIVIGPYGLNLLLRDSSIVLFGTVGLLYIMFTAGLEIDLEEFKKNRFKSFVFGIYTFIIPMILGTIAAFYLLAFDLPTSILLASMFASHTLACISYCKQVWHYKNTGLLHLPSAVPSLRIYSPYWFWQPLWACTKGIFPLLSGFRLGDSHLLFLQLLFLLYFPIIARWFFKKFEDNVSQYIFVSGHCISGLFFR